MTRCDQTLHNAFVIEDIAIQEQRGSTATQLITQSPKRNNIALLEIFVVHGSYKLLRAQSGDLLVDLFSLVSNAQYEFLYPDAPQNLDMPLQQ